MKKLITHNGSFHTDDIFAAAMLSIMMERANEPFEIVRTRDEEIFKNATADDYIFDVGGIYDEVGNRFDHHQVGGAGRREEEPKIEYSSFGLVWKKFGAEFCGSQEVAFAIDKKLVQPVDAIDNGFDLAEKKYSIFPYLIQDVFSSMVPTWQEDLDVDKMFLKCVEMAKEILLNNGTLDDLRVKTEDLLKHLQRKKNRGISRG